MPIGIYDKDRTKSELKRIDEHLIVVNKFVTIRRPSRPRIQLITANQLFLQLTAYGLQMDGVDWIRRFTRFRRSSESERDSHIYFMNA
eukprot:scaffold115889_cov41-Attheya_sp.AAC.2